MVRMTKTQIMRKSRLTTVLNQIKNHGSIELNKLVGLFSLNFGFSGELTRQYVRELCEAGYLKLESGLVSLSDDAKKVEEKKEQELKRELEEEVDQYSEEKETK